VVVAVISASNLSASARCCAAVLYVGAGAQGNLFPALCLGFVRFSWCHGSLQVGRSTLYRALDVQHAGKGQTA
jgi:hypothetical protein